MSKNKNHGNQNNQTNAQTSGNTPGVQTPGVQDNTLATEPVMPLLSSTDIPHTLTKQQDTTYPPVVEITGETGVVVEPVKIVPTVIEPVKATAPEVTGIPEVDYALVGAPTKVIVAFGSIMRYIDKMAPAKLQTSKSAIDNQLTLNTAIMSILNNAQDNFPVIFNALIVLFRTHGDGVFHEKVLFRSIDSLPITKAEAQNFACLLNLIKVTAGVVRRQDATKGASLSRSLAHLPNEEVKSRLVDFYSA